MTLRSFFKHQQLKSLFSSYCLSTNRQKSRYFSSSQARYKMSTTDYSQLPTPSMCYVDFCLVPVRSYFTVTGRVQLTNHLFQIGTGNVSVAREVAEVQKVLKASGVRHTMHSAGTTVGASRVISCLLSLLLVWEFYEFLTHSQTNRGQLGRSHEGYRTGPYGRSPDGRRADPDVDASRFSVSSPSASSSPPI